MPSFDDLVARCETMGWGYEVGCWVDYAEPIGGGKVAFDCSCRAEVTDPHGRTITIEDAKTGREALRQAVELALLTVEALGIAERARTAAELRTAIEFPLHRIEGFGARFLAKVQDIIVSAYVWARGGIDQVTDGGWRTVAELVVDQGGFAEKFLEALKGGTVSEAQAVARSRQYAGAAIGAFERGKLAQVGFDAPVYPTEDCEGLTNCRCWWEIVEFPDRYEGTWHAVGDKSTCGPCKSHARQYSPLKQMKPVNGGESGG